jgi:hypothetical protein
VSTTPCRMGCSSNLDRLIALTKDLRRRPLPIARLFQFAGEPRDLCVVNARQR